MTDFTYPYLNTSEYARKKLGSILKPLEERWFKELHFLLSTKWPENQENPPIYPHTTASLMCLSIVSGISSTLYKPGEYNPHKSNKKHFTGVLTDFYPWSLDKPKNLTPEDAVNKLYTIFRNPAAHSLNIRFPSKEDQIPVLFLLPHIEDNQNLSERIIADELPFGSNSLEMNEEGKLKFSPASFYWGIRKMTESMTDTKEKVDAISLGLKTRISNIQKS